ncbi:hypothetical protein GMSM_14230 [Geomonas sp. Red276]
MQEHAGLDLFAVFDLEEIARGEPFAGGVVEDEKAARHPLAEADGHGGGLDGGGGDEQEKKEKQEQMNSHSMTSGGGGPLSERRLAAV